MSFTDLSSILKFKHNQAAITAAGVVALAQMVVGERGRVLTFKNGKLKINVPSSVAAANLKLIEEELVRQINARLGKEIITRIIYRVGE